MLGDTANTHLVEEESARKIRMSEERGRSWALEHGQKKKKKKKKTEKAKGLSLLKLSQLTRDFAGMKTKSSYFIYS